ncbi:MAG TPA: 30S ribosomal protein S12 methylthiotransferase RimO [Chloroflexi bacterium]|nr:30S ribosomal protein S12 methylthiotransferase RimO [Chloroflexota bacterium]
MRYHLVTLGCAKNVADSEGIGALLRGAGYRPACSDEADVLIVNTCGFLQAARHESVETLNALGRGKRPGQLLVAAGCLSERLGAALQHEVPGLDGIIGTQQWSRITEFLERLQDRRVEERWRAFVMPADARNHVVDSVGRRAEGHSAYLKIADGCSAPCAFCTIPSFKGLQRSKRPGAVIAEAQQLVAQGVEEIVLVAQDLTAYGHDWGESTGQGLPTLLEQLCTEVEAPEGRLWFRLMYAYPGHATERLIEVMAHFSQILPYLDMPLQHGDRSVLKRMRRPHNMQRQARFFEQLRATLPDITLRTTFIVGHPGEGEAEFERLLEFMSAMQFDKVGIFQYSSEPGTISTAMADQVPAAVKQARWERAMAHQQPIALARQEAQLGRVLDVLVEGWDPERGVALARSYREAPEVDGYVLVTPRRGEQYEPGDRLTVRIGAAMPYDLEARTVKRHPRLPRQSRPEPAGLIGLGTIPVAP